MKQLAKNNMGLPAWRLDTVTPLKRAIILEPAELLQALNNRRVEETHAFEESVFLNGIEETIQNLPVSVLRAFLDALVEDSLTWKEKNVTLLTSAIYDSLSPASTQKRMVLASSLGKHLALHKKDFVQQVKNYLSPENLTYYAEALEESFRSFVEAYTVNGGAKELKENELIDLLAFLQERGERVWLDFCFSLPASLWSHTSKQFALSRARVIDSTASIAFMEQIVEPAHLTEDFLEYLDTPEDYMRSFAKRKILEKFDVVMDWEQIYSSIPKNSTLYLNNLLDSTPPSAKIYTMEMLMQKCEGDEKKSYDLIIHLINVLRNELTPAVLHVASQFLIKLSPSVSPVQRRELIDELLRSVSKENYPSEQMLRVLAHYMREEEDSEFHSWSQRFSAGIKSAQESRSVSLLWGVYELLRLDPQVTFRDEVLINLLLNGIGHFKDSTASTGLWFVLKLLDEPALSLEKKSHVLNLLLLKIYGILQSDQHSNITYVFMRRYFLKKLFAFFSEHPPEGYLVLRMHERIAFFPGTFDPFSSGHKAIAMEVAAMGYEVFLAVDEFSWSKATTANLIRREILNLSIADEFHLHVFPREYSINIANPKDLCELRNIFKGREITMLMGGDVILHASAYKEPPTPESVHSFAHILFTRDDSQEVQKRASELQLSVQLLDLGQFSGISSTRIREGIERQKDISGLVDSMAKEYIYEHDLYAVDEKIKHSLQAEPRDIKQWDIISWDELTPFEERLGRAIKLREHANAPRVLELKMPTGEYGFIVFHWIRLKDLHKEVTDPVFYRHVSEHSIGRLLCIDAIYHEGDAIFARRLLQEFFRFVLPKDYTYCIYSEDSGGEFQDVLHSMGFSHIDSEHQRLYYVDMSHPCTLSLDVEELILEPYVSSQSVQKALGEARDALREAIVALYPGQLLLSMDQVDIYDTLIPLITEENDVPSTPLIPRQLGEALCVPFGEIFKKRILPNTVTKSMHTEKYFCSDLKGFYIEHFPGYLDLEEQVRMVRSFDRPLLLVDDLLHKGYRLKTIYPILKDHGLKTKKLFVGILSGSGKSIAEELNMKVESAYFIPRLRFWFQESKLYPYIGGDSLDGEFPRSRAGFLPSTNLLFPYTRVVFIHDKDTEALIRFSEVCLRASLHVLKALEAEYLRQRHRLLRMDRLGEVLRYIRYPVVANEDVPKKKRPSELLEKDLQLLQRLRGTS